MGSAQLKRTELKRTRMKRRPRKPKAGDRPDYLALVRTLPCSACGRAAPSHAHHEILNGRGKSQKAPDDRSMPMCARHHEQFHQVNGWFDGWTKEQRREWQALKISETQDAINARAAAACPYWG